MARRNEIIFRVFGSHYLSFLELTNKIGFGTGIVQTFLQTLLTQVFVLILNVITGVLTARELGPEGRGLFAAIVFWPQLIATLSLSGMGNAVIISIRNYPTEDRETISASLVIALTQSLIGGLLGVLAVWFSMRNQYPHEIVVFTAIATMLVGCINLFTMLLRPIFVVFGNIAISNRSMWANPLIYLALYLSLMLLSASLAADARAVALCQFGSAATVLIWMIFKLFYSIKLTRPRLKRITSLIACASRLAPSELIANASSNLDRLALLPLVSPSDLGVYAVAFSLSRILTLVQVALSSIVLPALTKLSLAMAKDLHDRIFRCATAMIMISICAVAIFGERLIVIMYGESFSGSGLLLILLSCEASLGCLNFILTQMFILHNDPHYLSVVQFVSLVVAVFCLLLVFWIGSLGAALGLLLASLARFFLLLGGLRSRLSLPLPSMFLRWDDIARIQKSIVR